MRCQRVLNTQYQIDIIAIAIDWTIKRTTKPTTPQILRSERTLNLLDLCKLSIALEVLRLITCKTRLLSN